ncbi:hypothetical protein CHARACLAT_012472 [Characodon lateralis]|uniref:Fibronectin type-III domain-containing protein n=1 Tax=Characodon lateralis TaxID=208331 RepID=A0ABU7CX52_9TELE|nr:hypothetical protein [Characodon lateralis]
MTVLCILKIFLISLCMQFDLIPLINCTAGIDHTLSKQDVLLIKDTENPKCFTRTLKDFTCFFETTENRTYDFLYKYERGSTKKCEMPIYGTDNGTFLHVCFFPRMHIFLFTETEIEVVDRTKNTSLYKRTVSVEDLCLLEPPFNVSLQPNDNVGKLSVFLDTVKLSPIRPKEYRVRYSSVTLGEKTVEVRKNSFQLPVVPGEEVEVQASVKCVSDSKTHPGHWSAWSKPVVATVPKSADKISLVCFTSDLQHVTCLWNSTKNGAENEYKLFYKMSLRQSLNWTEWTKCQEDQNVSKTCSFRGDNFGKIKVKLNNTQATVKPLFFSEEFTLNKSIKSAPPSHLKGVLMKKKLCLEWEAPLPSLSIFLQYEVDIQIKGGEKWSKTTLANTSTCVELPSGCQFSVKVRAKPDGLIYSGYWSDWSNVFSSATTPDTDMLLLRYLCVSVLIIAISLLAVFFFYCRKLKQYIWPPVPNLEKFLQGFLIDINQQKWGPPATAKLCFEETTSSVVEIMSDNGIPGLDKPSEESSDLLFSDGSSSTEEQADESAGGEGLRDYVTLNKDLSILCLKENSYVYEQFKDGEAPDRGNEHLIICRCVEPCSCNNYFNRSYLPLAMSTESLNYKLCDENGASNPYTNLHLT